MQKLGHNSLFVRTSCGIPDVASVVFRYVALNMSVGLSFISSSYCSNKIIPCSYLKCLLYKFQHQTTLEVMCGSMLDFTPYTGGKGKAVC